MGSNHLPTCLKRFIGKDTEVYIGWHFEAKGQRHLLEVQGVDIKHGLEVMGGVGSDVVLVSLLR